MVDESQNDLVKAVYKILDTDHYLPVWQTAQGYVIRERFGDGWIRFPFDFDRQRITVSGQIAVVNG